MKLQEISIENYRSITSAKKIPLDSMSILVGRNNEGKSNILRALVLAMRILAYERSHSRGLMSRRQTRFTRHLKNLYDWEVDFPIRLKKAKPRGNTIITLDFSLSNYELKDFKEFTGSNLSGSLPIKISINRNDYNITVAKPGAKKLSQKSPQIAYFIASKIQLQYIPPVRTAEQARETIGELIGNAFLHFKGNDEYQQAIEKLEELQRPILDKISSSVTKTLKTFLPNVKKVKFDIQNVNRILSEQVDITVDDGTPTLLENKGDGVQSLIYLGVARHSINPSSSSNRNLVIAIEEPESHLHPMAIHELRDALTQMSEDQQVVITTHNPVFIDRVNIKRNILVDGSKARPAKNVEEIRSLLGVRAADNLMGADIVLIVEGESDRKILSALTAHHSPILKKALDNNAFVIDSLSGAGNLTYKLSLLRDSLCLYHCLLDNDASGIEAFDKAEQQGLIEAKDVSYTTFSGKSEAEIEDWLDPSIYREFLKNKYEISIDNPKFKTKKKWSERMKVTFQNHAKNFTNKIEHDVKATIADLVFDNPSKAVLKAALPTLKNFIKGMEERLKEITSKK